MLLEMCELKYAFIYIGIIYIYTHKHPYIYIYIIEIVQLLDTYPMKEKVTSSRSTLSNEVSNVLFGIQFHVELVH